MSFSHRNPHDSVPNDPPHDNFNPAAALETLHTEIVDIEAFAHAAGEAVTRLPHTSNPEDRRTFARIYTLVTRIADDVGTVVAHGDELIATLSEHLQRRQTRAKPDPQPPAT
jgi:hypothetical protein